MSTDSRSVFPIGVIALNIGFIGGGALAGSIVRGIADKLIPASNIFVAERIPERVDELKRTYRINATADAEDFIHRIDLLIIAVKPKDARAALSELIPLIDPRILILSVVAGFPLKTLENILSDHSIVRAMPNVSIAVGESMTALARGSKVDDQQLESVQKIFSALGRCIVLDESLMDAVTGLSGSGPAFAFLMIDALSDGGVAAGLPRGVSIELAAQTLLGAAKMVLAGEHPDVLRDRVTSPAGTTIEGVRALERGAVRSALIEAVLAATERSKSLGH